ncbi:M20 aminoacylase family protein [Rhizobium sp. CSW-27]|uniref:M20 aminoacylase family protein n=1 Tax=Rhizobium sp. CSW-27 TaxID=2839985 RepID=UPI001C036F22|nr:M20 aminoacylase family protein [Rhizobium sp. CSW-27]MBT9369783.1 amidohydrolase [Rhizobium sp. CSW-27]
MSAFSSDKLQEAIRWRHHLHAHPELGFQEIETARFVAERLSEWGYAVRTGYGRTGLVGSLTKGSSRKALGIRADMDALPILEETGAPYASKSAGVMHACGHDGHVTVALAAARELAGETFDGTLHFIFQPAEENEGGARAMVEDGLFRDFPMDAVLGMHNWPALPVGTLVARDDEMMAAFGTFEVQVVGRGAHGAMPHEGADPVLAASQIVSALNTIASRNISPLQASVVSVTQIHGGDAWNVIPERVVIRGTTRWFNAAVGDILQARLEQVARSVAEGFGCRAETDYQRRYPATINNAAVAAMVRSQAAAMELQVIDAAPSMAAEDFAFMLDEKPGCYFWLGAARATGDNPGLHSPRFDFNDQIIPGAVDMWRSTAMNFLR